MPGERSLESLRKLFVSKTVADLPLIKACLGGVSDVTARRWLKQLPYRHSYNHNGRYYALHEPSRYDPCGLWSVGDIHFSVDGNLKRTVRRLVHEAEAGATHRELVDRLQVRVHNTLLDLLRRREVQRERLMEVYVYLHVDQAVAREQLQHRREQIAAREESLVREAEVEMDSEVVIQVLLTLIRFPGSARAEVVRRLRGHVPRIGLPQVRAVFSRYSLDEKGGGSIS